MLCAGLLSLVRQHVRCGMFGSLVMCDVCDVLRALLVLLLLLC
jgi:hypothetical protein